MRWEKLGRVYVADAESGWARSHAYMPTPRLLGDGRIRVYVAFLDESEIGRLGYVDVAENDPTRVLGVSRDPLLDIGERGTFDDSGVTPMSLVADIGGRLRLYYTGWQRGVRVPYFMFTGLASSRDGGATFVRERVTPVLDRLPGEHVCRSAAFVSFSGDQWTAWYVAGSEWISLGPKIVPTYNLRQARSEDGVTWSVGTVVMDLDGRDEFGFGRPYIMEKEGSLEMWYSIRSRSKGYRLGYATSQDGLRWSRRDSEVGIDVSESGWDSEMICFGAVLDTAYGKYLFYNGNDYGRTGFGVAVLDIDG